MTLRIETLSVDCRNPRLLAEFWMKVLDYQVTWEDEGDPDIAIGPKNGAGNDLLFLTNRDPKLAKNRWHLDLRPDDQDAEVERLEILGAKRVDIGQGDVTWVVMADPEGNEFCVLRSAE